MLGGSGGMPPRKKTCSEIASESSLSTAPWHVMDIYDDVNDMWHFFVSILYRCLDMYAPSHTLIVPHPGSHLIF